MIEVLLIAQPNKLGCNFFPSPSPMETFILLFSIVSYHLNHFEITNETISTMHSFILKFHSYKFYFGPLVINDMI
jgi:hypothetical protein